MVECTNLKKRFITIDFKLLVFPPTTQCVHIRTLIIGLLLCRSSSNSLCSPTHHVHSIQSTVYIIQYHYSIASESPCQLWAVCISPHSLVLLHQWNGKVNRDSSLFCIWLDAREPILTEHHHWSTMQSLLISMSWWLFNTLCLRLNVSRVGLKRLCAQPRDRSITLAGAPSSCIFNQTSAPY